MFVPFHQTLRSRVRDRSRDALLWGIACALCMLALGCWFALGRVWLYAVSSSARVEVASVSRAVDAPITGRLSAVHVALGRTVSSGEVLFEIDGLVVEEQLAAARARRAALDPQLATRQMEQAALRTLQQAQRERTASELATLRARAEEQRVAAAAAAGTRERAERLRAEAQLISEADFERARSDAARLELTHQAAELDVARVAGELAAEARELDLRLARLRTEASDLESQRGSADAEVRALERDLQARSITAPLAGELAEVAQVQPGAVVQQGQRLATIIPSGGLRVVAQLAPESVLGRVRAQQPAYLRLDAFPAEEYGAVELRVTHVSRELRDALLRVELEVAAQPARLPLEHGLSGSVEIAVEEVSPWQLALRRAGRLLNPLAEPEPAPAPWAARAR